MLETTPSLHPSDPALGPKRTAVAQLALQLLGFLGGSLGLALLLFAHRWASLDAFMYLGMVLVSAVAIGLTRFHLRHAHLDAIEPRCAERIIWLTAVLSIGGVQLMTRVLGPQDLLDVGFLLTAPLMAQAMLVSALAGPPIALFSLTVVTFMLGIAGAMPVNMLAASWLAGAVGAHAINPMKRRSDLIRATTVQSAAMAVIACCITAVAVSDPLIVLESAGWAAVASVGAVSLFWLGVTLLERLFGIVSDWSLLELSSPDHPLIRALCLRAPGTYAHSVIVGNLAEAAARDIGANPVLARTMAIFHDVGKMMRPHYFSENQTGLNPHDGLSPSLSAMIVAAHVKDGVALARRYRLPQVLIDGIAQHHGTQLIAFFFARACGRCPDETEKAELEPHFRYEGPRPRTKEAAILMLADSVEAVSRTVAHGQTEQLEGAIRRIVEERRADGQLDECDLTLRELEQVQRSFIQVLTALRHERVPYPDSPYEPAQTPPDPHLEPLRQKAPRGPYPGGL